MEDWRVFSRQFLVRAYRLYFGLVFDDISQIHFVDNSSLRNLLEYSSSQLEQENFKDSIALARVAVDIAVDGTLRFEIGQGTVSGAGFVSLDDDAEPFIVTLENTIIQLKSSVALLSRGIKPLDYERFKKRTPTIKFFSDRIPQAKWGGKETTLELCRWVYEFAVSTTVQLQQETDGFMLPPYHQNRINLLISKNSGDIFEHV